MAIAIDTRQSDFSEMDNAKISREHWKIMFPGETAQHRILLHVPFRLELRAAFSDHGRGPFVTPYKIISQPECLNLLLICWIEPSGIAGTARKSQPKPRGSYCYLGAVPLGRNLSKTKVEMPKAGIMLSSYPVVRIRALYLQPTTALTCCDALPQAGCCCAN